MTYFNKMLASQFNAIYLEQLHNHSSCVFPSILGDSLVQETIRQIMAARAINNLFKMSESVLKVTDQYMQ